jgi:hypothetical protein
MSTVPRFLSQDYHLTPNGCALKKKDQIFFSDRKTCSKNAMTPERRKFSLDENKHCSANILNKVDI